MPAHVTLSVIVDGSLESDETYTDDTLYRERLREIADDAADHGYPTEVFVVQHDHAIGIECECVQYLTDHKPVWSANMDGPGT